jgi:hypothetical protein
MQLTAQEIGTLLREECAPIVVINNDGYTIKRAFHGPHQRYHNVPSGTGHCCRHGRRGGADSARQNTGRVRCGPGQLRPSR